MPNDLYRKIKSELLALGFKYLRAAKGSHEIWHNDETGKKVIVPFNLKSRHADNGILKSAGSSKKL